MRVNFSKLFGLSFRYPFHRDVYLLLFAVNMVFAIAGWFLTGYFIGDVTVFEDVTVMVNFIPFLTYAIPLTIAGWLVTIFLIPAYFDNVTHFHKGKRKALAESFAVSKKRFLPALAVFVILGLVVLACLGGLILSAASVLYSPADFTLLMIGGLWSIIGIIVGVVFFFMTFLSPVFCVVEKARPLESIKKSWKTAGKNKVSTLLFLIILTALYIAVAIIGTIPESVFNVVSGTPQALSVAGFSFMLVRTVFNTYLALFAYSSLVSYYFSIKKAKD